MTSHHKVTDELLKSQILTLFMASRRLYGSPRTHKELQARDVRCGRKRVARLMRELGSSVAQRRKRVRTTDSSHTLPVVVNYLDRKFQVDEIVRFNQAWFGDITYIPIGDGWLYLAVVLDRKSRKVIGWSMGETMDSTLVQDARTMAMGQRQTRPRFGERLPRSFHIDRGTPCASNAFQSLLNGKGVARSMSRKDNCWQNAPADNFIAKLKKELVYREKSRTVDQARASLSE